MKIKFSWSKSSVHEVFQTLFREFTPEEIKVLDGKDCAIPHMYSVLLQASAAIKIRRYSLDEAKHEMKLFFFSNSRVDVKDPQSQENLFWFFNNILRCCQ